MTSADFNTARELAQYVVDTPILQAAIVQIIYVDSRWFIFHF